MKEIVFLNGKFIPQDEAKVSVLSPGFLYGFCLFETMRSYHNNIVYFQEHLERIKKSCKLINLKFPYTLNRLKELIQEIIRINGFTDAYVRLTLGNSGSGTDTVIMVKKYKPYTSQKYREGFRGCLSRFKQNEGSFFSRLKTANYLLFQLAYLEAKDKGFDEAVILNNRGFIAEGSRANIFLIKDNEVFTPALECGCLNGITRKAVFDLAKKHNIKIYEGNFIVPDLYQADEAFLTNSLMGIMPLVSIEKRLIKKGLVGKMTRFFIERYNSLLKR